MRRFRLAPGFSVVPDPAARAVWLVAGEDLRYKLGVDDPEWLAALLAGGAASSTERVARVAASHREDAEAILARLVEERVLVEAGAEAAHVAVATARVVGAGAIAERLRAALPQPTGEAITVVVQDRLDHAALLAANRAHLAAKQRWLWVTTGPGARAYVGPLFVPDAGPCAECLLVHFKRLSPVPELYDALIAHGLTGGIVAPAELPLLVGDALVGMITELVRGKLALAAAPVASSALYALHVVEARELSISLHAPLRDRECAACGA